MSYFDNASLELRNLERAVREVKKAVEDKNRGCWLIFFIIVVLGLVELSGRAWHSKYRYALQYSIGAEAVHVDKEPHDCAFLAAPLGEKYCHYEPVVLKVLWAKSTTGKPITSTDDGKTWNEATPAPGSIVPVEPKVTEVYITWDKKDD